MTDSNAPTNDAELFAIAYLTNLFRQVRQDLPYDPWSYGPASEDDRRTARAIWALWPKIEEAMAYELARERVHPAARIAYASLYATGALGAGTTLRDVETACGRDLVLPEEPPAPAVTPSPFDALMRTDDRGEFWSARDLMGPLGYRQWRRFADAIERARLSITNAGMDIDLQIRSIIVNNPSSSGAANVGKMGGIGQRPGAADARKMGGNGQVADPEWGDFRLTRYGAYVLAMNGDPRKPEVAAAQHYFAARTREAELLHERRRDLPPSWRDIIPVQRQAIEGGTR